MYSSARPSYWAGPELFLASGDALNQTFDISGEYFSHIDLIRCAQPEHLQAVHEPDEFCSHCVAVEIGPKFFRLDASLETCGYVGPKV